MVQERFVEREPMWDGNVRLRKYRFQTKRLSENQCGMETEDPTTYPDEPVWVEREPMWDGN